MALGVDEARLVAPRSSSLSLAATAALPWLAFVEGHPFRIRYMVPLDRRSRRSAPALQPASAIASSRITTVNAEPQTRERGFLRVASSALIVAVLP